MCKASEDELSKLRIIRAYTRLLCIPQGSIKMVLLARIGSYEVRMLKALRDGAADAPLFSMELFDHDAQSPVRSCDCHHIDEEVAALEEFISR